ncbi:MAG TPA: hypothetical protein ENI52_04315 [Thermoplasmata archaeon]|nr:hypothetical protein [Thermoplasmata archaeon]
MMEHIYGVDIDEQAVEVTKLSLHLKVLEGETAETLNGQLRFIAEPALPNLGKNIRCGNSLIGPDFYRQYDIGLFSDDEIRRINVFDWYDDEKGFGEIMREGGFDAVIGNPPYVNVFNIEKNEREYYKKSYYTCTNKSDKYAFFIEIVINKLLSKNGYFSFIVSNSWLTIQSFRNLRKLMLENTSIESLALTPKSTFIDAVVETIIFSLKKKYADKSHLINYRECNENNNFVDIKKIPQDSFFKSINYVFNLNYTRELFYLIDKINDKGIKLELLAYFSLGIKSANNNKFIKDNKINENCFPVVSGKEIKRYYIDYKGKFIWYEPKEMKKRKGAGPRNKSTFLKEEKIFVREISRGKIISCIDNSKYFALDTVNVIIPKEEISSLYIIGLLNSKLLNFWYGFHFSGLHVKLNQIRLLPIRTIDFNNPSDVKMHDEMVRLVERMMDLKRRYHETDDEHLRTQLDHAINATDSAIDALVYRLYGLTDEEIRIVEGG